MTASNHGRSPLARLALAGGGTAVFTGLAAAARAAAFLAGGPDGILAGVLLIGVVFGACGLVFRGRPRRAPELPRPAETVPEPAPGHEEVKSAA